MSRLLQRGSRCGSAGSIQDTVDCPHGSCSPPLPSPHLHHLLDPSVRLQQKRASASKIRCAKHPRAAKQSCSAAASRDLLGSRLSERHSHEMLYLPHQPGREPNGAVRSRGVDHDAELSSAEGGASLMCGYRRCTLSAVLTASPPHPGPVRMGLGSANLQGTPVPKLDAAQAGIRKTLTARADNPLGSNGRRDSGGVIPCHFHHSQEPEHRARPVMSIKHQSTAITPQT